MSKKNNTEDVKPKDERFRNWWFIQYDDSAPSDWRDKLNELHIPWVESPLHEFDFNADGSKKKAHRHIIISSTNKLSFEQVQEISNLVSGVKPERIKNMIGTVRYLAHLDNPEKHQYDVSDIVGHCGFDKDRYLKRTASDVREILKDIFKFIRNNNTQSYSDFVDYCIENDLDDWFEVTTMKHTLSIKEYIKSYTYKHMLLDESGKPVCDENGEPVYVGDYLKKKGN